MSSISSFLLQKDHNWYQEAWLGLIQNYEGSTTSPNFWSFFINHFDLRFRCPAGVNYIEVVSMLHKTFNQKTLSWLLDVIFAATSFNPPRGHFQASSNKWQKITWFKYRQIPKRNYFLLACSILIISLPKVSLIPRHQFSVISASISSFISVASSFSSCSFMSSFSSLLLQKDQNWYQESWLGLIQNYEGSTTSPNNLQKFGLVVLPS